MEKRVYGVLGIVSKMANWNADFSGYPKTISTGEIFGSDKAFKYPMKRLWDNQQDKKVLYIKSLTPAQDKKGEVTFIPRTLKERYEYLFAVNLEKSKDGTELLKNLFTCIDVKNFGATFAEVGNNISITGAVQLGQGFNKYEGTEIEEQPILSPFRDPTAKEKSATKDTEGEEARNSTLGIKIVSNEAHYFYPFAINPLTYKEFVELGVTEGYTEEDYAEFKKTALCAATSFATNSKAGCDNEFALFVETREQLYLPNLAEFVTFEKREKMDAIQVNCGSLLRDVREGIIAVQIFYNPYTIDIETDIEGAEYYNIFTGKGV